MKTIWSPSHSPPTELIVDDDVKAALDFLYANVEAAKLVAVAEAVADLAGILWGHYDGEPIEALQLRTLSSQALI